MSIPSPLVLCVWLVGARGGDRLSRRPRRRAAAWLHLGVLGTGVLLGRFDAAAASC